METSALGHSPAAVLRPKAARASEGPSFGGRSAVQPGCRHRDTVFSGRLSRQHPCTAQTSLGATKAGGRPAGTPGRRSRWGMTDQRREVWNKRFAARIRYYLQDYFARRGAEVFARGRGSFMAPRSYNRLRRGAREPEDSVDSEYDVLFAQREAQALDREWRDAQGDEEMFSAFPQQDGQTVTSNSLQPAVDGRVPEASSGHGGRGSDTRGACESPKSFVDAAFQRPLGGSGRLAAVHAPPTHATDAAPTTIASQGEGHGLGAEGEEWIADESTGYDFARVDSVDGYLKCCVDVGDVLLNQNASVAKVYVSVDGDDHVQRLVSATRNLRFPPFVAPTDFLENVEQLQMALVDCPVSASFAPRLETWLAGMKLPLSQSA
ncbi:hypothetical protein BESB_063750 [Besnoitia besnoiti]|uniref:Uncharacterized protein n=1 Tax=Besnoitia besnoiti TaxID=94643 RepID=A0A2A9MAI6_BESBE|nr:hypothetical protein BESB_063750 [Besnoitia besnoiti]PFH35488.1 hypothetical protein BESB_063750 [Besnoitia besnoiti]